ncbi:MAG: ComEA family DNA-binding protein, partial [Ilumatobacteraceae bacterium]
ELDALNLAAPVVDGQRIYVPAVGEVVPSPGNDPDAATVPPAPIDVNSAPAIELERLPGVGPTIAAEIVDDRERNGPFPDVDALIRVRGIGPAKLDAVRELVLT